MGLKGPTGRGWGLRCSGVHSLGRAPRLSDRRLLFCETGKAVSLAAGRGDEVLRVTHGHGLLSPARVRSMSVSPSTVGVAEAPSAQLVPGT